jgi:hypothetical protein
VKRELDNLVLQMHAAGISYTDAVREFKKRFLLEVLVRHRGNQCKAAEELGMHRNTLSRTLAELDLDSAQIRKGIRRPPRSVRPIARPTITGAATTWLLVNIAAALAPPSHTASATSGLPEALMPAVTADQRNPSGRV